MAPQNVDPSPVDFEVGYDRFIAQAIAAECESEGHAVQLLTMDNAGQSPGALSLQPHRILSAADDADSVSRIVRRWVPEGRHETDSPIVRAQPVRLLIAATLLAILAFALLAGLLTTL